MKTNLELPVAPSFQSTPVGESWRIDMHPSLQPAGDDAPLAMLESVYGWDRAMTEHVTGILNLFLDRYQRRLEEDKEDEDAALCSETEPPVPLVVIPALYRATCPNCRAEMRLQLSPDGAVKEEEDGV